MTSPAIVLTEPRRFAFCMQPRILRAVIPRWTIGTYVLLEHYKPIYVGRSDICLLARLCFHEHSKKCTHVVWEPKSSAYKAYLLESHLYHQFLTDNGLQNKVHPACPWDHHDACPFCLPGDISGLRNALPYEWWGTETVLVHQKDNQLKNSQKR